VVGSLFGSIRCGNPGGSVLWVVGVSQGSRGLSGKGPTSSVLLPGQSVWVEVLKLLGMPEMSLEDGLWVQSWFQNHPGLRFRGCLWTFDLNFELP